MRTTHWLLKNEKGELPEIEKTQTVELPPYAGGKAGELWVMRTAKGDIEVVSSDLQPDHPQWPGRVKGWPTPSQEYMRERWTLHRQHAEHTVNSYRKLVAELNAQPKAGLRKAWEFAKEHNDAEINGFLGPDDPAYEQFLKKEYANGLRDAEARLQKLEKEKP